MVFSPPPTTERNSISDPNTKEYYDFTNTGGSTIPLGMPQLAVWPLSGNKADQEDFQQELRNY